MLDRNSNTLLFGDSISVTFTHMRIHRYRDGSGQPYELTFEADPDTRFYEIAVAKKASMPSIFDRHRLKLDKDTATKWAKFGFSLIVRKDDNGEFRSDSARLDKSELKTFGGLLLYYSDITDEELTRVLDNNPADKNFYGERLLEGEMAAAMHQTIEDRVKVPQLWTPGETRTVGFQAITPPPRTSGPS